MLAAMGHHRMIAMFTALVVALASGPAAAQSPAASPGDVIDQVSVVILQLHDPAGGPLAPDQLETARKVIEARVLALPGPGATVTVIPEERIRIDLVDPSQLETVTRVATAPGVFRIVGIPSDRVDDVVEGQPLPGDMAGHVIVGTGHTARAAVGEDQMGGPTIDLELDASAADALDAWAADHYGETVALILDDIVMSVVTLQATEYDGRIQISGSIEPSQVEELVATLSGGPLPVSAEPLPDCLPAACPVPSVAPAGSPAT
jgi:preprotein translocase subunit SecD